MFFIVLILHVFVSLHQFYIFFFFFFNDTATTEIYTLSLRRSSDLESRRISRFWARGHASKARAAWRNRRDRKSTRLNSSHPSISYAVFCLKKKKEFIMFAML